MNPVVDLRVIQTISWVKDEGNGWMRIPVGYEIQMKRENSDSWISLDVIVEELPNPEKEAEDGQGTA